MAAAFPRGQVAPVSVAAAGLSTGAAYASGDHLGGVMTFQVGMKDTSAGASAGCVKNIVLVDKSAVIGACELWLFRDTSPTVAADNAALSIADSDLANLVGIWTLSSVYTTALNKIVTLPNAETDQPYHCGQNGILYGVLVTRSANNQFGAATDLTVHLMIEPEV